MHKRVMLAIMLTSSILSGCAQSQVPSGKTSYVFALGDESSVVKGIRLRLSIADGDHQNFMVDTGSTGIVVSKKYLGSNYTLTGETFKDFTYSSSGNSYSGQWVIARVKISSPTGTPGEREAQTIPMKIRMVEEFCIADGKCSKDQSQIHVAMMGVGFDRVDPHGTNIDPTLNPFLNLTEMAVGSIQRGYILTPHQVTLGVTEKNRQGFETIALQPILSSVGQQVDWQAPTACLDVPSAQITNLCGNLLVDTGLNYSITEAPEDINPPLRQDPDSKRQLIVDGQTVVVRLPGLNGKTLYSYTVGNSTTGAPTKAAWGHATGIHGGQNFMNTSMYTLSQLDYLYDAQQGEVGFKFHPVKFN